MPAGEGLNLNLRNLMKRKRKFEGKGIEKGESISLGKARRGETSVDLTRKEKVIL